MPAGEAGAPGARPNLHAVFARRLPEREIARVALARIHLTARARQELLRGVPREPAVGGEAGDVVVDGSVDFVGVPEGDQPLDHVDHLRYEMGRVGVMGRRPDVELGRILHERGCVVSSDLLRRLVLEPCRDEHLVLAAVERVVGEMPDVGDVHNLLGLVAEIFEAAAQKVGQHERAQVADVHVSVDGRAA